MLSRYLLTAVGALLGTLLLAQNTYYVTTTGSDDPARDGLTSATAFASLPYACTRAAAGSTIDVGPGLFVQNEAALPKPGTTIRGAGSAQTTIRSGATWTMVERPKNEYYEDYLIAFDRYAQGYSGSSGHGMTVRDLRLESTLANLTHGGIYFRDLDDVLIEGLEIVDFAWAGIAVQFSDNVTVRNCLIENANRVEDDFFSGNIHTAWLTGSDFHNNTIRNTVPGSRQWGVGYKGGGHTNCRIFGNDFTTGTGFDIEIPFEQERGLEIFDNQFDRPVSIPKPGPNGDPASHGFDYSIWLHDNVSTYGYAIEGPRGYLRVSHNYFATTTNNHRTIAQFGGHVSEPMWVHNNVVVGVDRSFIWKGGGTRNNVEVYNNTVYYDVAGGNKAATIDLAGGTGNTGWQVHNNLFVMPAGEPRAAGGFAFGTANSYTHNLLVNAEGSVPTGNFVDTDPGLTLGGTAPDPYYRPASAQSFVVDAGIDVGLPYEGAAPDIGAFELAAALPVELLAFYGEVGPAAYTLHWEVGWTDNFSHYEVEERRTDGSFERVTRLDRPARTHRAPWPPDAAPLRYFRLRLVDLDGRVEFSPLVALQRSTAAARAELSVHPNPSSDFIEFVGSEKATYRVIAADGRTVREGIAGAAAPTRLSVRYLLPGTYRIWLTDAAGRIRTGSFVRP